MSASDELIEQAASGDRRATRDLFRLVYEDLRNVAAARLAHEAPGQTLTATALVHEAFLRLGPESEWNDSTHLCRTATRVIRQILIDAARKKRSLKGGGDHQRADLEAEQFVAKPRPIDPVELHEALDHLAAQNPQAASVFELRYYAGLTWEQIAETLGVSVETTNSLWSYARAKLAASLTEPI